MNRMLDCSITNDLSRGGDGKSNVVQHNYMYERGFSSSYCCGCGCGWMGGLYGDGGGGYNISDYKVMR